MPIEVGAGRTRAECVMSADAIHTNAETLELILKPVAN